MLTCMNCGCDVGVVEMSGPGVGRGEVVLTAMCPHCYRAPVRPVKIERLDAFLDRRRLATPERPLAGVEQYDRVPPPAEAKRREDLLRCEHGHGTARFECMRCLGRSVLCDRCSVAGVCPHCGQRQPRNVEAFMDALEAGFFDAPLTPAEMEAEAHALDDHFGADIKIRIWGDEGRER